MRTRLLLIAGWCVAASAQTPITDPIPEPIAPGGIPVELEPVITGMAAPLGMVFPDDNTGRAFVYDQAGQILVLENGTSAGTLLDLSGRLVALGVFGGYDERGLLGMAVHPDFSNHPLIYTYTSEPATGTPDFSVPGGPVDHHGVIAEWSVSGNSANTGSRREILRFEEPQFNHNGGPMRFGPDGFLYFSLGDGGGADDDPPGHSVNGNGQDLTTHLGKLHRIDVDIDSGDTLSANGQYAIPQDNPFVGVSGLDEIYAYGFRNPYSFSFDTATGDLYLADVGQNKVEELNLITKGGNYGWRTKEGSFQFDTNGTGSGFVYDQQAVPGLIDPIAEYDHDEGLAIVGGFIYHGSDARLDGRYIAGDFSSSFGAAEGRLFYLDESNEFREMFVGQDDAPLNLFVKGFAQDPQGEIYVCASTLLGPSGTTGGVYKIVPLVQLPAVHGVWLATAVAALGLAAAWLAGARRWQRAGS